jgi:hypothetical protein
VNKSSGRISYLELKDAGLVAADAAGQVGGEDAIANLGVNGQCYRAIP